MPIQILTAGLARHHHPPAYAAIVLAGGYEEAGEAGRVRVGAGEVLVHGAFSAHRNQIHRRAEVLNLALPPLHGLPAGAGRVADVDELVRLALADTRAAAAFLLQALAPAGGGLEEPPDRLAAALRADPTLRIADWADGQGIARATAFRWFQAAYGVSPTRYRVESRARDAWLRIVGGAEPLADIAAAFAFADQAHMTRDVRALTGAPPSAWRTRLQHPFKTGGRAAA